MFKDRKLPLRQLNWILSPATIMSYVTAKGHKTWKLGTCSNYYHYYRGLHSYFKRTFLYERSAWNLLEYKEHAKNMPEPVRRRTTSFSLTLTFLNRENLNVHNVLHGIRVQVKFCSFNTLLLMWTTENHTTWNISHVRKTLSIHSNPSP